MSETPKTWRDIVKQKLVEWGPLPRNVLILRLTPLMPPGYAWQRYVVDSKRQGRLDVENDGLPEPSREEMDKAQRALVLWFLRQLRRDGQLLEEGGKVSLKPKAEARPKLARGSTLSVADVLQKSLTLAAEQPIEDLTDTDALKPLYDTARDLADRLEGRLTELDYWWEGRHDSSAGLETTPSQ